MYTYTPRTIDVIRADIAKIRTEIDAAPSEDLDDLEHDYLTLLDEFDAAVAAVTPIERYAPTGGLDLVKVAKAFGPHLPKDWDEDFLP